MYTKSSASPAGKYDLSATCPDDKASDIKIQNSLCFVTCILRNLLRGFFIYFSKNEDPKSSSTGYAKIYE